MLKSIFFSIQNKNILSHGSFEIAQKKSWYNSKLPKTEYIIGNWVTGGFPELKGWLKVTYSATYFNSIHHCKPACLSTARKWIEG